MDTNAGEFVGEGRAEVWMQHIRIGEVVEIKGEELEVVGIGRHEITLKLLGQRDRDIRSQQEALEGMSVSFEESKRQRENMLKRQR